MRLNKFLADCGVGSRRHTDTLISEGRVTINGRAAVIGDKVNPGDQVRLDGRLLKPQQTEVWLLHKPPGYLCSRRAQGRLPSIYDILPPELHHLDYVGRLDAESEGALLLTNDGELAQKLTRPAHGIEKEYLVLLDKPFDFQKHAPRLLGGMNIQQRKARFEKILPAGKSSIRVVLTQGIKRQIRVLLAYLGYEVKRLTRVRIGSLELAPLKRGQFRRLRPEEVHAAGTNPHNTKNPPKAKKPVLTPKNFSP